MNDICKVCEEPISMCDCDFAIESTDEALQYMRQRIEELEAQVKKLREALMDEVRDEVIERLMEALEQT